MKCHFQFTSLTNWKSFVFFPDLLGFKPNFYMFGDLIVQLVVFQAIHWLLGNRYSHEEFLKIYYNK